MVPATNLVLLPEPNVLIHLRLPYRARADFREASRTLRTFFTNDYDLLLATNDYETMFFNRQTTFTVCSIVKLRADEILNVQIKLKCSRVISASTLLHTIFLGDIEASSN